MLILYGLHGASTVLESTFAYSLNHIGTPVLVVEMGVECESRAHMGKPDGRWDFSI